VKEKNAFWLFDHATKIESVLLALLVLFLPTQFGKHFWPQFSLVTGIRVDYLSPTVYFTDILVALLFIFYIKRVGLGIFRVFGSSPKRTLVSFFVVIFLAANVLFAERIGLSLYYLLKLVEFAFVGYYVAKHLRTNYHMPFVALLFAVSTFFQALLAILQYIKQGSLDGWLYFLGERTFTGSTPGIANADINGELLLRPYGTMPHPNVLAGYLLISSILIAWFLIPRSAGFVRYFGIGTIILAGFAIALSLSRIIIVLALVILVCLFLYWLIKKRPKPRLGLGLLFAALLDLLLFLGGIAFFQTIASRFSQTSFLEEAFVQRGELIGSAVTMILSNPALGVGLGHFIPTLAPLQDPLSVGLFLQPVHNIYLLIASELGILGLLLFLAGIGATYRHLLLSGRLHPPLRKTFLVLTLLLSIIMIAGFFDHYFLTLQQGQLLFAFILGLCWATFSLQ
jgi:O-antigen ligase